MCNAISISRGYRSHPSHQAREAAEDVMLDIKKAGNDLEVQTHKMRLSHHVFFDGKMVATLNQGKTFRFGPGQTIVLRQGIDPQTTIRFLTQDEAADLEHRGWETPTYDDLSKLNVNPILKSFAREKGLL